MNQKQAIVIEDSLVNTDVLVQILSAQGFQCSCISSPIDLPGLLSQMNQPDVIFLDLELPKQTGFELLEQLKTQFTRSPVICYTAHTSEIGAAKQAGFDGFLGKPLNVRLFPDQLRRILSGQSVWEV